MQNRVIHTSYFSLGVSILGLQNYGDFFLKVTRFKVNFEKKIKQRNAEASKMAAFGFSRLFLNF
jgi:hypothetical protein